MALASDTAAGDGALRANLAPTRARILRSTYRIMGVKGGMRFALREVADDAGVSKALLLYHFRTKESLVLATLRWVLDAVAARIQRAIEPIETAGEKVEVMLDTIFIRADLNRHFYLVYADLLGLAARMEAYGEVATTFHDTVNAMYAEIADLGIREGIFAARDYRRHVYAMAFGGRLGGHARRLSRAVQARAGVVLARRGDGALTRRVDGAA